MLDISFFQHTPVISKQNDIFQQDGIDTCRVLFAQRRRFVPASSKSVRRIIFLGKSDKFATTCSIASTFIQLTPFELLVSNYI